MTFRIGWPCETTERPETACSGELAPPHHCLKDSERGLICPDDFIIAAVEVSHSVVGGNESVSRGWPGSFLTEFTRRPRTEGLSIGPATSFQRRRQRIHFRLWASPHLQDPHEGPFSVARRTQRHYRADPMLPHCFLCTTPAHQGPPFQSPTRRAFKLGSPSNNRGAL